MVDTDVADDGVTALAVAIRQLLHDAQDRTHSLPQNGFQQRMRFAGLVESARDVSTLALAAVVLLRRSRQDKEPI